MSNGKASKKFENEKAVSNEAIEATVLKHYITYAEMPSYVANLGGSITKQYKDNIGMMATHIGLITANMKQIKKSIENSKLSKASQQEILQWMDIFNP